MQIQIFTIPIYDGGDALNEVNKFLRSHRVAEIQKSFIPWMAVQQLSETQKELVRPFAIPIPSRRLVMATNKNFIRHTILTAIIDEIQASVPKAMHSLTTSQVALF